MEPRPLVVFDFDCTIVEVDCDPWIAKQLGATPLMDDLRSRMPWNDMMDTVMGALHSEGKTIKDVEEALKCIPLQPEKIAAIKLAHANGCELHIVSDANSFYISTILDKFNVTHLFTEIHTNPASIDSTGRLRIGPFHSKSEAPHGCPLCPPNMCKGIILKGIQDLAQEKKIIYIGDGRGDLCPSLLLKEGDSVLPREGYPLLSLLLQNTHKVKATVCPWNVASIGEILALLIESPKRVEAEPRFENVSDDNWARSAFSLVSVQQAKAAAVESPVFA